MADKFKLTLEGVPYEIERKNELLLVNGQEFPLKIDGKTVNVGGNPHTVELAGRTATVDGIAYAIEALGLEEPKPSKRKAASAAAGEAVGAITAIMPGLIVKILKAEGDKVAANEVVLILEAMKMQNELRAKQAGVVKQILVKQGETVEMRQVLAIIDL